MDTPNDAFLKRPLYLYDLPPEILDSITPKSDISQIDAPEDEGPLRLPSPSSSLPASTPPPPDAPDDQDGPVGSLSCSMCCAIFASVADQKLHVRSDFHRYNLKLRVRGRPVVTEAEFDRLIEDLDESLSGSDSSAEDEEDTEAGRKDTMLAALLRRQAVISSPSNGAAASSNQDDSEDRPRVRTGSPFLWLSSPHLPANTYLGLYRVILTPAEQAQISLPTALPDLLRAKQLAPVSPSKPSRDAAPVPESHRAGPHIFLCMIGGGHFAAMVAALAPRAARNAGGSSKPKPGGSSGGGVTDSFNRQPVVLAHKTFHRYTTRRKQGGAQSANDNAKGAAHSAGASLRRYNEAALTEDVRGLLAEWKPLLDTAELLFVRATGASNRRTLFGPYDGQVLRADDVRIRGFPFNTRRATQTELTKAFAELTRLKVREEVVLPPQEMSTASKSVGTIPAARPSSLQRSEEEETAALHTAQIQALVRRSKLPALLSYLSSNGVSAASFRLSPAAQHAHAPTALHLAAATGSSAIVRGLLVRAGADPTLRSSAGRSAYDLAADRATRDAFRVARAEMGEDAWDWDVAGVPAAMDAEEVRAREGREKAERERDERARRTAEEERLRRERGEMGGKEREGGDGSAAGRSLVAAELSKRSAQDRREDDARGMTPEMRTRLERERRARAAEERMRRMRQGE